MKDSAKVLLAVIVGLAILLSFASAYPDGLETVAQNAGIEEPEGLRSARDETSYTFKSHGISCVGRGAAGDHFE